MTRCNYCGARVESTRGGFCAECLTAHEGRACESRPGSCQICDRETGAPIRRTNVGIDDALGPFPALVPNRTWNGWAMPYFDARTARAVVGEITRASLGDVNGSRAEWHGDVVRVFHDGDTECEEIAPVWIRGRKYWPIGAGSWTWEEIPG